MNVLWLWTVEYWLISLISKYNLSAGISSMRAPQAQPNGYFIDTVEVSENSGTYEVKLFPHHCGYNFPVPEIAYATVSQRLC